MNPKRVWKVVNDLKFVRTWWRGGLGGVALFMGEGVEGKRRRPPIDENYGLWKLGKV